jgi:hypothetical protein
MRAMKHPLENLPGNFRKPLFWTFLAGTLVLFVLFRVLNTPLITPAASGGIVTFELAGDLRHTQAVLDSWDARARLYAAFGLGLDYLFMVFYATALMLGTLLAAGRHAGWIKSLGGLAGWAALVAALLDAVENIALWTILTGGASDPWPGLAAACASVKFAFLGLGLLNALAGWVWPKKT